MLAIVTSHPIQYQAPLWRALAAAGIEFEVWFLTPHALQPSRDREFNHTFAWDLDLLSGYPHRFLAVKPDWDLTRFNGIRLEHGWGPELRGRKVTALWLEGWRFRTLWQAAAAARHLGIPVWVRGESHDLAPVPFSLRALCKRLVLGRWLRRTDAFLCIGSANRRFYRSWHIPEARLHAAPYCVDNARFAGAARELAPRRAELRRRWGITEEAYCVLFCGKLIPKKRPLDLIAAVTGLAALGGRAPHLLFAGDGELAGAVKEKTNGPGLPAGTITGFLNQTQVPEAFAVADCLVLPSDYGETWGLVANEALASGVPVIASDHCGCAEDLAAPLGRAHVYPCGDVTALRASLQEVALHPPAPAVLQALVAGHAPERTAATVSALLQPRAGRAPSSLA